MKILLGKEKRRYLLLIFILAFGFMLYEMAVLREMRFQILNIFMIGPFLFTSVLWMIGLGSLFKSFMPFNTTRILKICVILLILISLVSFFLVIKVPQTIKTTLSPEELFKGAQISWARQTREIIKAFFITVPLSYGVVFILQGIIFASLLSLGREKGFISEVYAADLFASGTGAILGGVFLLWFAPIPGVFVATLAFFVAAFVARNWLGIRKRTLAIIFALLMACAIEEKVYGFLQRIEAPKWLRKDSVISLWTPYQRIDVNIESKRVECYVDGWYWFYVPLPSGKYRGDVILLHLLSGTRGKTKDILVIGPGLGRDVLILNTLEQPDLNITAVELDPGYIQIARAIEPIWKTFKTAEIVVGEGRFFLENTRRKFDLIYYAELDPRARVSNLSFPDANFMYTDSALRRSISVLRPEGFLYIRRIVPATLQESVIRQLCSTLRRAGITKDQTLIYLSKGPLRAQPFGMRSIYVFVKSSGFSKEELKLINEGAGFADMLAVPWDEKRTRPTTDIYPFSLGVEGAENPVVPLIYYLKGFRWLTIGIIVVGVLLLARLSTSISYTHFFLLGTSFMLVECILLFHSFLLIGNPWLSASLAVGVFLFGNAIGSLLSRRVDKKKVLIFLLPLFVALYAFSAPFLTKATLSQGQWVRFITFTLAAMPVAIMIGTIFPVSLRVFTKRSVPGLYFIDLVGCGIAPLIFWSLLSKFDLFFVSAVAAVAYLLASIILFKFAR